VQGDRGLLISPASIRVHAFRIHTRFVELIQALLDKGRPPSSSTSRRSQRDRSPRTLFRFGTRVGRFPATPGSQPSSCCGGAVELSSSLSPGVCKRWEATGGRLAR
jgi:hypothetical protein